jgi:MoxR-like ATPase
MESGSIARFEEITRCASEVQDAMISLLSEKRLSIPELSKEIPAAKGFSIIATANTRDRGVNDMSAALKRRFNIVVLPSPATLEMEMDIVRRRVRDLSSSLDIKAALPTDEAIEKVVTIFRELRTGQTLDGKNKVKSPSGVLSTAEAISVLAGSMALAANFGTGSVSAEDLASSIQGAVVKDEDKDKTIFQEYVTNVLKKRGAEWRPLFNACSELLA